jgi:hypothetical protein
VPPTLAVRSGGWHVEPTEGEVLGDAAPDGRILMIPGEFDLADYQ